MEKSTVGIVGCGDFLRLNAGSLKRSEKIRIKSLFDPDGEKSGRMSAELGGSPVNTMNEILDDPEIDSVFIFTPPWVRKEIVTQAAERGKSILTTKPLAADVEDCQKMIAALKAHPVAFGVIYNRTGNAFVETCREIFQSGRYGRLALYRQEWLHHFPHWNQWALDPGKNGGPFMDAMIHNLNTARYLMARPVAKATFFSDNLAHPEIPCADLESMKLDFQDKGVAMLSIAWAADLAVYRPDGNSREHLDFFYLVTDKGYFLTPEKVNGENVLAVSKDGKKECLPLKNIPATLYDRFAGSIRASAPLPADFASIEDAAEDIRLIVQAPRA